MNELKHCPFCGSSEDVHTAYYHFDNTGTKAVVECSNCACSTDYCNDIQSAIYLWNNRTHAPELKPCPFCGGVPHIEFDKWNGKFTPNNEIQTFVKCSRCRCLSVSSNDINDVILAWNNRGNF